MSCLSYIQAFDYAIEQLAGLPPLAGRLFTIEDAMIAVKATHLHCGPTARLAEDWLKSNGIQGAGFHSLSGHYVLRDQQSGLLFDAETVTGCRYPKQLPVYARTCRLAQMSQDGTLTPERQRKLFKQDAEILIQARLRVGCEQTPWAIPCAGARLSNEWS